MQTASRKDRIKGVMLGQAAGDALGAPYEFGPPVALDFPAMEGKAWAWPKQGENGDAPVEWRWEPGEWTDDTDQAIIVALSRNDPHEVANGLLGWIAGRPKDVGISTGAILARAESAQDVLDRSVAYGTANAGKGKDPGGPNGSLMRTAPVALPLLGDVKGIVQAARQVSDVTHYGPDGYTGDAVVVWSLLINEAITGERDQFGMFDLAGALRHALDQLVLYADADGERIGYWVKAMTEALTDDPTGQRNGGVIGAFKAALHAVRYGRDFESTVRLAVSFGRDTDTVAAIAGGLAGAIYGASDIPQEWVGKLHGWAPDGPMDADGLAELALYAAGYGMTG